MAHPLVFQIAPLAQLPEGETSWEALRALQGPSTGFSPAMPNHTGLPGFIATFAKCSSSPVPANIGRARS